MSLHLHEDDFDGLTAEDVRAYCAADPGYVRELDDFRYTPLLAACSRGRADLVQVLLEAGADPNFASDVGKTPLVAAVLAPGTPPDLTLFDLLLAAGADANEGGMTPLHYAVWHRHRDLVRHLVGRGADPNAADGDDQTPIFWARNEHGRPDVEMIRLLIELGADLTCRNDIGQTVERVFGPNVIREANRPRERPTR